MARLKSINFHEIYFYYVLIFLKLVLMSDSVLEAYQVVLMREI